MSEPVAWMLECQNMGGDTGWILSWSRSGAGLCNRLIGAGHEKALFDAEHVYRLESEIVRLLESREREGDRLDWLLTHIRGDELRRLVGEMNCTNDVAEWRDRLDSAMHTSAQ